MLSLLVNNPFSSSSLPLLWLNFDDSSSHLKQRIKVTITTVEFKLLPGFELLVSRHFDHFLVKITLQNVFELQGDLLHDCVDGGGVSVIFVIHFGSCSSPHCSSGHWLIRKSVGGGGCHGRVH